MHAYIHTYMWMANGSMREKSLTCMHTYIRMQGEWRNGEKVRSLIEGAVALASSKGMMCMHVCIYICVFMYMHAFINEVAYLKGVALVFGKCRTTLMYVVVTCIHKCTHTHTHTPWSYRPLSYIDSRIHILKQLCPQPRHKAHHRERDSRHIYIHTWVHIHTQTHAHTHTQALERLPSQATPKVHHHGHQNHTWRIPASGTRATAALGDRCMDQGYPTGTVLLP
jgi:hypothetical protein